MHGFLYLYILYSPALSKSSAGVCLPYLFSLFLRSYIITSPHDSPSSSPALPHPGSACPAILCSAFFPAEPSPTPPGRRFCLVLFPIFFLFRSSGHLFFSRNLLRLRNDLIFVQDNFFYDFFFSCFYVFFHIPPTRNITFRIVSFSGINYRFSGVVGLGWGGKVVYF